MTAADRLGSISRRASAGARLAAAWLVARREHAALAWAVATLLALASLAGAPGVSRDEARVLARAGVVAEAAEVSPAWSPPLGPDLARAAHALGARAGFSHVRAARLGTAAAGALLSALLALLGWDLAGAGGALLTPALFWLAPRHLHAGLVATPDLALATLATATVLAYRRSRRDPDPARRLRAAAAAGVLFGAALATRIDAWTLLAALAAHAALRRLVRGAPGSDPAPTRLETRLRGVPVALVAMAVLGPAVLVVSWPWLWSEPLARIAAALAPGRTSATWQHMGTPLHGRLPLGSAIVIGLLTLPATFLWTYAGGLVQALRRVVRATRDAASEAAPACDDLLLLVCTAAPIAAASVGVAPALAGVRPWIHAMPFLAPLAARALVTAARLAWPSRAAALTGALAVLVLYPALRATGHFTPAGASSWNELAGGAPGAASLRMQRQDGGEAVAALLDEISMRARPAARIWWDGASHAIGLYATDGRLRPDLQAATSADDADLAVVAVDGASRDAEYRAWTAFRSARPVAGAYLDEVPLAWVYARPGAWR